MSQRCRQLTASGAPCKNWAVEGADRCSSHLRLTGPRVKLTPLLTQQIAQIVRSGNYIVTACAGAGISRSTFYEWWGRGDPAGTAIADAPYRLFRETVELARAQGEALLVNRVALEARGNWQAAIWLLERQFPERWARVSQRKDETGDEQESPQEADEFAEVDELAAARAKHLSS